MTPCRGDTMLCGSSQQLPRLRLGPLCPLSPWDLLPELQRYKDTVSCTAVGTKVPGHCQKQLLQNLIVCLLKTHFFTLILDF